MSNKSQDDYKIKSSPLKISTMTVVSNIYDDNNATLKTSAVKNSNNTDTGSGLVDIVESMNINLDYLSRFVKIYKEDDEDKK